MTYPAEVSEPFLWTGARDIIHFVGVNGAGKTMLANKIAARCVVHGGKAILDSEERAYSSAFDRENAGRIDRAIHGEIVESAIDLVQEWHQSDANVIVVDRWYETYLPDFQLPLASIAEIESAIQASGFNVRIIHLVVGLGALSDDFATMQARLAHTKANRPAEWWDSTLGTFEEQVQAECDYQAAYRSFCRRTPFSSMTICTTDMRWAEYEQSIVDCLAFERRWRGFSVGDAMSVLRGTGLSPSAC